MAEPHYCLIFLKVNSDQLATASQGIPFVDEDSLEEETRVESTGNVCRCKRHSFAQR